MLVEMETGCGLREGIHTDKDYPNGTEQGAGSKAEGGMKSGLFDVSVEQVSAAGDGQDEFARELSDGLYWLSC